MTDTYTEELFGGMPDATDIVFPISRIVLDPERFEDDSLELMAQCGMGVVYTHTSQKTPLRRALIRQERNALLDRYYRPHHAKLEAVTEEAITAHGGCLIIDAHSFPSHALPYELDASLLRPEICIGTDAYHTPPELTEAAKRSFTRYGFEVALDAPFSGTLVPAALYHRDRRAHSLMIEVRRDLYMDKTTGFQKPDFRGFRHRLRRAVGDLSHAAKTISH